MSVKPRVLIEDWLPVAELGIESRREAAPIPGQFPKLKALHVWWARRPLVASAAVALAGLLPAWSTDLAKAFPGNAELSNPAAYRSWLLRLVGIWGDPIAARKRIVAATERGETLGAAAYGYRQAFKNMPGNGNITLLHAVLRWTWGGSLPLLADPTAGGGSIPFVSARLGIPTFANDLNAVATTVLKAGVEIPVRYGHVLTPLLEEFGNRWLRRVRSRLEDFFVYEEGEKYLTYIWANAVRCPRTGGLVPLITDQWLNKSKGQEAAVRVVVHDPAGNLLSEPVFELARGDEIDFDPSVGLMTGGTARSPYDDLAIDDAYIKSEARTGRFEQVLYAVYYRKADRSKGYRAPSNDDYECLQRSRDYLSKHRPEWEASGCLPTQEITETSNYDRGHRMYGISKWADMFTDRQLVVHAIFAEELQRLATDAESELGRETGTALMTVLGMLQAKALNYSAKLTSWDISRQKIRSVFEKHNFTFRWTFAEFQGSRELPTFALDQVLDAYGQLVTLVGHADPDSLTPVMITTPIQVTQGSAADLSSALPDGSVAHLCMDPPYYDNVMYAELSDFFYVWEKATLGRLYPEFFWAMETDKDDEAIANVARFATFGRRKKELADADYTAKMTAIFAECNRVLRPDGVMTVMFTHKKAEAWDSLGLAIIAAGFTIETSWPVNTESEASSHQKNKNAANSTIMLGCRKREGRDGEGVIYLEDIESEIRQAARNAVLRFQHDGIAGVDLLLSTYGPTLSVISRHWPVYSSTPNEDGRDKLLRPEDALSLAREEIVELRRTRLVGKGAKVDTLTDFVLLAWDTFGAREFPYDTARLLALAVGGLDIDELEKARILKKGSGTVKLLEPGERVRRGDSDLPGVRAEASSFAYVIDAVDTALYIAEHDGMPAAKRFVDKHGLTDNLAFIATLQGLVNAIPRTKLKGVWAVPKAGQLDLLCTLYFPDVSLPEATDVVTEAVSDALFEME